MTASGYTVPSVQQSLSRIEVSRQINDPFFLFRLNCILMEKVESLPEHALLASAIAQASAEANAPEGLVGVFAGLTQV
jgi:hypothetical protein